MTESTALTVQQRAEVALGMKDIDKTLIALAEQSKTITAITNNDGYEQCRSARISLKNQRVEIQKKGKQARDDANAFSKAVINEEKRLIALIEPEETRLQNIEAAHEEKLEVEKQAKIAAELKRVNDIQARIEKLKGDPSLTSLSSPDSIENNMMAIENIAIDDSFDEFKQQASDAKIIGMLKLRDLHTAAVARVAEEARIKAEREELARLRAEQEERDRKERIRIAEEERREREVREVEMAAERERLRLEREELDRRQAEQVEAQRKIDEENARLELLKNPIVESLSPVTPQYLENVISQEVVETLLNPTEFIEQLNSKAVTSKSIEPTDDEIIDVLCKHFNADKENVEYWIRHMEIVRELFIED